MAIERVSIENFTVFDKIEIDFCKGVNIFIGENGTGKTHLLKALYAHNQWELLLHERCLVEPSVIATVFHEDEVLHSEQVDSILSDYFNRTNIKRYPSKKMVFNVLPIWGVKFHSIYIPAKDMLSMSKILKINDKYSKSLDLDKTLVDIIKLAQNLVPDEPSELAMKIAPRLEGIIDGTVFVKESDLTFWVRKRSGLEVPFSMEAEGFRKLGLLWQLLMNESITKDTILFWDEPEANLNPTLIPVLVDILLELSKEGVQIFLATHEYNLARYFDLKRANKEDVKFHSLYKGEDKQIYCESFHIYQDLENKALEEADEELGNFIIQKAIEERKSL